MDEWLEQARARLATASRTDEAELALSAADAEVLLDLARVAAHTSGDRTNAPLACYLVGLARGRNPELDLATLVRTTAGEEG
jgi:hypothetical protein